MRAPGSERARDATGGTQPVHHALEPARGRETGARRKSARSGQGCTSTMDGVRSDGKSARARNRPDQTLLAGCHAMHRPRPAVPRVSLARATAEKVESIASSGFEPLNSRAHKGQPDQFPPDSRLFRRQQPFFHPWPRVRASVESAS